MQSQTVFVALALALLVAAASAAPRVGPANFQCPPLSQGPTPTTVNELRPSDIKVMMAIGDSITAAFAAEGGMWEYRDESWSIGANPNATTLFNFFRYYSPDLVGGSTQRHFPEVHHTPHSYPDDYLNAAQSEAKVADINKEQVSYLLQEMQTMGIDIENDWKVLTIWIGANDICESCVANDTTEAPDVYMQMYDEALQTIHENIPRLFVNLIPTMNLSYLAKIDRPRLGCDILHSEISECYCVFQGNQSQLTLMDQMTAAYNDRIHQLAAKYNALDDQHAYVVQPFLQESILPDASYLSTLDCFHPSLKTHQALAIALWNSMLTPVAQKPWSVANFTESAICPDDDTLLYTS